MPDVHIVCETTLEESFRVQQVRGLFDLGSEKTARVEIQAQTPPLDEPWQIGLIVGPSGSGKSTVARRLFGDSLFHGVLWPEGRAVVDGFPEQLSIRAICAALTGVGFSSPPAWLRPYHVLSNGERFRCDLARALMAGGELLAFDEFTSVVDRTVAKIGSLAVAKAVRGGQTSVKKFVAISCHYDISEWLCPDWILDMATGRLARGALCRPGIELRIYSCGRDAWIVFARHHYLSGHLPAGPCFLAIVQLPGEPPRACGFAAITPVVGHVGYWRIGRIVVLPDYQGAGIGGVLRDAVAAEAMRRPGCRRLSIVTSHPGMLAGLKASNSWVCVDVSNGSRRPGLLRGCPVKTSTGRMVCSFVWRPNNGGG